SRRFDFGFARDYRSRSPGTHISAGGSMRARLSTFVAVAAFACMAAAGVSLLVVRGDAQAGGQAAVATDADDIGGVVTGPKGPEAGVWVIAETTELPTPLRKIVVTDDRGRY